jgi:hypothetical protein
VEEGRCAGTRALGSTAPGAPVGAAGSWPRGRKEKEGEGERRRKGKEKKKGEKGKEKRKKRKKRKGRKEKGKGRKMEKEKKRNRGRDFRKIWKIVREIRGRVLRDFSDFRASAHFPGRR